MMMMMIMLEKDFKTFLNKDIRDQKSKALRSQFDEKVSTEIGSHKMRCGKWRYLECKLYYCPFLLTSRTFVQVDFLGLKSQEQND